MCLRCLFVDLLQFQSWFTLLMFLIHLGTLQALMRKCFPFCLMLERANKIMGNRISKELCRKVGLYNKFQNAVRGMLAIERRRNFIIGPGFYAELLTLCLTVYSYIFLQYSDINPIGVRCNCRFSIFIYLSILYLSIQFFTSCFR